jgi:GGDEF domain-containing protein
MGRPYRLDYRLRSTLEDDVWYHVHERGFPRFDERQQYIGAEGFTQDISERVAQEEKIRNLAWHDPVTGLNNRARAIELLDRDAGQRDSLHQLSMVFIYLANLRDVQTVLGQEIADAAIRALAGRLKGMLEHPGEDCRLDADCLQQVKLARYDEHSLIATLPGELDKEKRDAFAHAIAVSLGRPLLLHGEEIVIKACIGIADYPEHADDYSELMRRAMLVAMQASSSGDACVAYFDPQHDRAASHRMMLERQLRAALEQGGQLLPYFQPKLCARSGRLTGAEVLLRWQHPNWAWSRRRVHSAGRGVRPDPPISEWLIGHVYDLLADWRAWGLDMGRISINLSADSLFEQPGPVHRRAAATYRRAAGNTGHRTDRERADAERRHRAERHRPVAPARHPHFARRLWHRLLVARLPQPLQHRRNQDRPFLRHRPGNRQPRAGAGPGHHHPRPRPGPERGRRRGRNRGPGRCCARSAATSSRVSSMPARCRPRTSSPSWPGRAARMESRMTESSPGAPWPLRCSPPACWLPPCRPAPSTPST